MYVSLLVCLLCQVSTSWCGPESCASSPEEVREGNNGQTAALTWLGVLRVHLIQDKMYQIALTGIVLVKKGYAIAVADDVAKLSRKILTEMSLAMFIPSAESPIYYHVRDYMTHPEHRLPGPSATIAILELDADENEPFPMQPICWVSYEQKSITSHLYAFGITDVSEERLLEKNVFKLRHVPLNDCNTFYRKMEFKEDKNTPRRLVCGHAPTNTHECVWDSGMVMATNVSGYWQLVGLGTQGPGCSAPARFIDLRSYFPWINTNTDIYTTAGRFTSRSNFNIGFRKNKSAIVQDIPIHNLFSSNMEPSRRFPNQITNNAEPKYATHNRITDHSYYPFDTERHQHRYYFVKKKQSLTLYALKKIPYRGNYKSKCPSQKSLVVAYRDQVTLTASDKLIAKVAYELSLRNLMLFKNFQCLEIKIVPQNTTVHRAYLELTEIDNMQDMNMKKFGDTPDAILQHFIDRPNIEDSGEHWQPEPHLKVKVIEDKHYRITRADKIYMKFTYSGRVTIFVTAYEFTKEQAEKDYYEKVWKNEQIPQRFTVKPRIVKRKTTTSKSGVRTLLDLTDHKMSSVVKPADVEMEEVPAAPSSSRSSMPQYTYIIIQSISYMYFIMHQEKFWL